MIALPITATISPPAVLARGRAVRAGARCPAGRLARLTGRGLPDRQKPSLALREQELACFCGPLATPSRSGAPTGWVCDACPVPGPPRRPSEILAATDYTHNWHQSSATAVLTSDSPGRRGHGGARRRPASTSGRRSRPNMALACAVQTRQHGTAPGAPGWPFDDSRSGGGAGRAGESSAAPTWLRSGAAA
jgi:hypothetical protein